MCRIQGFQKKCDLVTQLLNNLLTDKQIHKGAPLLKRNPINIFLNNLVRVILFFFKSTPTVILKPVKISSPNNKF